MTDKELMDILDGITLNEDSSKNERPVKPDIDALMVKIRKTLDKSKLADTAVISEPLSQPEQPAEDIFFASDVSNRSLTPDDTEREAETEFGFTQYLYSDQPDPFENREIPVVNQNKKGNALSNIMFYSIVIIAVAIVFIFTSGNTSPRNFFGYSYFTVLTTSMQSEIPKGSIVITKHVDADSINIGDDITFFKDENTIVTHRVVDIYEDFEGTGQRGFKTQGVDNPSPDNDIVSEQKNIIGVVKLTVPKAGAVLAYIKNNILLVAVMFVLMILISVCIRIFFANGEKKDNRKVRKKMKTVSPEQ